MKYASSIELNNLKIYDVSNFWNIFFTTGKIFFHSSFEIENSKSLAFD
jgi:hypothetical protein